MCIEGRRRVKINASEYIKVFKESEAWPEVKNWKRYDWFLVRDVPVSDLEHCSYDDYLEDPDPEEGDRGEVRVETIMSLLQRGHEPWPVILGLDCMVLDGFHRLTASEELGIETIDVIYPVKRAPKN